MHTITTLGKSLLQVQRVAFGCEQLGGYGWGKVDPAEVIAAVQAAVQSGPTLFDTADCYGKGVSEVRLGEALHGVGDRARVATKFGVRFAADGRVFYDNSREWAETALGDSLRRLRRERIDLYQLHHADRRTPVEATLEWLERQREAGRIGAYGVTNIALTDEQARAFPGLVSQSFEYSLANRKHELSVSAARNRGLTFIAYGVLAQGMLSGLYSDPAQFAAGDRRQDTRYANFHGEKLRHNLALVEVLRMHAASLDVTPAQLAISWVLTHVPGAIALVGIKNQRQFADALAALSIQIPDATRAELEAASAAI